MTHYNYCKIFTTLILLIGSYLNINAQITFSTESNSKLGYTAGTGNNRTIVLSVSDECNNCIGDVTAVTYGGIAMTNQLERQRGNDIAIEIWTLDEAGIISTGGGSLNFVITWDIAPTDELVSIITLENIDQTTPIEGSGRARGGGPIIDLGTIFSPSVGDFIYYGIANRNALTQTPPAGYGSLTELISAHGLAASYKEIISIDTEAPIATLSGSSSSVMLGLHFNFIQSGGFTATQDGDWNIGTTWGGACSSSCTEETDYPGGFDAANIPATMNISLPSGVDAICYDLNINSDEGETPSSLSFIDNTSTLTVNQNLNIQSASTSTGDHTHYIDTNGGDLIVYGNINLEADQGSASSVNVISASSSNTKTSYTPGGSPSSDRIILVTVGDENANNISNITSITWGGVALTQVTTETRNDDMTTEVWYLNETDLESVTPPQNFIVTWATTSASEIFNAVTIENINQNDPVGSFSSNNSRTNSLQLNTVVEVFDGDLMFYIASIRNNSTHTADVGYTELTDQTGSGWGLSNSYKNISGKSSEQPTATWSGNQHCSIIGVSLNAIGGGFNSQSLIDISGGNITVGGDINLFSDNISANAQLNISNSDLILTGDLNEKTISGSGQLVVSNATTNIELNGTSEQTLEINTATTTNNLTVSGSGLKTINSAITVNGTLSMQESATYASGTGSLSYGGSSTLEYAGSAAQTTGDELTTSIQNLTINNTNGITLNSSTDVLGTTTLTLGQVILGNNNFVANANTIAGYNENKYFVTDGTGYLERDITAAATVDFPIGISTTTLSNLVQLTPTDLSTFQMRVDNTFDNAVNDNTRVADAEWHVTRTVGSGATTIRVSWRDDAAMSFGASFDPSNVQTEIANWSGSNWEEYNTSSKDAATPDFYFEVGGFTSFGAFGVGSGGLSLPVELIRFELSIKNAGIHIDWKTLSEINNDHFVIQKSKDNHTFHDLTTVKGNGISNVETQYAYIDHNPYIGHNYYRIKQVDYDGQFELFKAKRIDYKISKQINFYPNPNKGDILNIEVSIPEENTTIVIRDLSGRTLFYQQSKNINTNRTVIPLNLNPGYYVITINNYKNQILIIE